MSTEVTLDGSGLLDNVALELQAARVGDIYRAKHDWALALTVARGGASLTGEAFADAYADAYEDLAAARQAVETNRRGWLAQAEKEAAAKLLNDNQLNQ